MMTTEQKFYTTIGELAEGTGYKQYLNQQIANLEAQHQATVNGAPSSGNTANKSSVAANKQLQNQISTLTTTLEAAGHAPLPAVENLLAHVVPLLRSLTHIALPTSQPSNSMTASPEGGTVATEDRMDESDPPTSPSTMEVVVAQAIANDPVLKEAFTRYQKVLELCSIELGLQKANPQADKEGAAVTTQSMPRTNPQHKGDHGILEFIRGSNKSNPLLLPLLRNLSNLDGEPFENENSQDKSTYSLPQLTGSASGGVSSLPLHYQQALSTCYYRLRGLIATYLSLYAKHRVVSAEMKNAIPSWSLCDSQEAWRLPTNSPKEEKALSKDHGAAVGLCRCHEPSSSSTDSDEDIQPVDSNEISRRSLTSQQSKGHPVTGKVSNKVSYIPEASDPNPVTPLSRLATAPVFVLTGTTSAGITVRQGCIIIPHVDTTHYISNTMPSHNGSGGARDTSNKVSKAVAASSTTSAPKVGGLATETAGGPKMGKQSTKAPLTHSPKAPKRNQPSYALPFMQPTEMPKPLADQLAAANNEKPPQPLSPPMGRHRHGGAKGDPYTVKGIGSGSDSELQSATDHSVVVVDTEGDAGGGDVVASQPPQQRTPKASVPPPAVVSSAGSAAGSDGSSNALLSPPALRAALGPLPPSSFETVHQILARSFYEGCLMKLPIAATSQPVIDRQISASMAQWDLIGSQIDSLVMNAVKNAIEAGNAWEASEAQLGVHTPPPQQVPIPQVPATSNSTMAPKGKGVPTLPSPPPPPNEGASINAAAVADKLAKVNQLLAYIGAQSPLIGATPIGSSNDEGSPNGPVGPILSTALAALKSLPIPSCRPNATLCQRLPLLVSCWAASAAASSCSLPLYKGLGICFMSSPLQHYHMLTGSTKPPAATNMLRQPFKMPLPLVRYDTDLLGIRNSSSMASEEGQRPSGGGVAPALLLQGGSTIRSKASEAPVTVPPAFTIVPNTANCRSLSACFDALRTVDESLRKEAALPEGRYAGGTGSGRGGGAYPPWELFSTQRAARAAAAAIETNMKTNSGTTAHKNSSLSANHRTLQQCILAALRANSQIAASISLMEQPMEGAAITSPPSNRQIFWHRHCEDENGRNSLQTIQSALKAGQPATVIIALGLDGAGYQTVSQLVNTITKIRMCCSNNSSDLEIIFDLRDIATHSAMVAANTTSLVALPTLQMVSPSDELNHNIFVAADCAGLNVKHAASYAEGWFDTFKNATAETNLMYQNGASFWLHLAIWCDSNGVLLPPCKGGHCSSLYNEMLRLEEDIQVAQEGCCLFSRLSTVLNNQM